MDFFIISKKANMIFHVSCKLEDLNKEMRETTSGYPYVKDFQAVSWKELQRIKQFKRCLNFFEEKFIKKGVQNYAPSPIKNWSQFKKQLVFQVDMSLDKNILEAASKLMPHIISEEVRKEINSKLQKETIKNLRDSNVFYVNDKTDEDKLNTTLMLVYRKEKDRQFLHDKKKLEKSYEISR
ncbi:hypothetical protein [Treponema pectinovorum]|uniref:hypothetical protein n=1 Tax=Treponema pectinovorum TaxID=164 RepID=UPI0011F3A8F9|nr:hypothetical protein [Treponema pectinovorum]